MAHMLLVNPRRRKARRASPKRKSAPRRRRTARRSNPAPAINYSPVRRKRRMSVNPRRRAYRRRRNPIGGGSSGRFDIVKLLTEAAIGGVGALAVDVGWGQINPMLPAMMQSSPTTVGIGDALKALATAMLASKPVNRMTRGWGAKIAKASLTVQARDIASTFLPATMPVAGMGYFTPGRVVNASARIGPNMRIQRSASPLLNRYTRPGVTPLLNAVQPGQPRAWNPATSSSTAMREGVVYR